MTRKDRYAIALLALFLITAGIRIYIAMQTPNLDREAYFTYRQVESIKETLMPTYNDQLSYGGRLHIFQPAYYYLLAPFAKLLGTELTLKVIPNILASLLILITYLIVLEITKKERVALFSAFASAFIPAFFKTNTASPLTLAIPLITYLLYCFMKHKDQSYMYQFVILSFLVALTSPLAFVLVLGLLIYLLLTKLDYKTENKKELELILFFTVLVLWINILIFKKAFLMHSYSVIWQNKPADILANLFMEINIFDAVTGVGIIPLLLGIFAINKYMLKEKNRRTYLLMAFAVAVALILWFKLITLQTGLIFLGVILIPLMAQTLANMSDYVTNSRIAKIKPLFIILLVAIFFITSVIPAIKTTEQGVTEAEMTALNYLRTTEPDATVLATTEEGNLITTIAKRKNVADTDFLLIRNPEEIEEDIKQVYTTILATTATETLSRYNVSYIYFSPRAKKKYGVEELKFVEPECFEKVYDNQIRIYKVKCRIE